MSESPIFIVGCDRSGTTLLQLMLNSHPHLFIALESTYFFSTLRQEGNMCSFDDDQNLEYLFNLIRRESKFWKDDQYANDVRKALFECDRTYASALSIPIKLLAAKNNKKRWGDKTPRYIFLIEELHELYPQAKFLHLIRDGRDVACSLKRVPWFSDNIVTIASFWKKRVKAGRRAGKRVGRDFYMEIHYEDLVRRPEVELQKICDFLNEPYTDQMLSFYEHSKEVIPTKYIDWHIFTQGPVTSERISTWKRNLTMQELSIFELVGGSALRELGYQTFTTPSCKSIFQYLTAFAELGWSRFMSRVGHRFKS